MLYCPAGYAKDPMGCDKCACSVDAPRKIDSDKSSEEVQDYKSEKSLPEHCTEMPCLSTCTEGYVIDADGCPTCRCRGLL